MGILQNVRLTEFYLSNNKYWEILLFPIFYIMSFKFNKLDLNISKGEINNYFNSNTIVEDFDFNNLDFGDDDISNIINNDINTYLVPKNIENMKKAGMLCSHELNDNLKHVQNVDFTCVFFQQVMSWTGHIIKKMLNNEFPEAVCFNAGWNNDDIFNEKVKKFFTWNKWSNTNDVNSVNSKRVHIRVNHLNDIIEKYNANNNLNHLLRMCQVWISPDNGVYGIAISEGHSQTKYIMFIYTGFIMYDNINKIDSQYSKDQAVQQFMHEVLCLTGVGGEILTLAKGWSYIPDKNGYPRLMTVIYSPEHFYKKCPKTWYAKCNDVINNWSKKIKSPNPNVIMRRNSNNGLVEMGVFFPWPLEKLYNNKEWRLYQLDKLINLPSIRNISKQYKENPQYFGVFVYQLSNKGKQMFDEFVSMNYDIFKWKNLWDKYTE